MNTTKKITIHISKEKMELLKQLGISPQEIFVKGFEECLRQKYREFNLLDDDDDEDEIEYIDVNIISKSFKEIEDLMINDNDIANN